MNADLIRVDEGRSPADDALAPASTNFIRDRYLPWLVGGLILVTVIRLAGLRWSVVDLFYDESQYWSWAQDPALGYFSKPPLLAWLLTGWTHLCGNEEWCVRSPAPIIYAGTALAIYFTGRQLYDERTGFWAALMTAFSPAIVFSSRIISTDVPMLLFWSVAMLAYLKLLEAPQKRWGIVLGLAAGLGLLSKYAMIYFIPGAILAQFVSARARSVLRTPAIWLALAIAVLVVSPNIIWNSVNSFATFRHTGGLVLGEPFQPSLWRALDFLFSQIGVIGPILFPVMMLATLLIGSRAIIEQDRLMIAFFIPPIIAVTLFAIYSKAYSNWAAPSLVPSLIAGTAILLRQGRTRWLWASIVLGIGIQAMLLVTDSMAYRLPARLGPLINPYARTLGWRDYAQRASNLALAVGARTVVVDDRRSFNTLRYYLRRGSLPVVSWNQSDEPPYDFIYGLTERAAEPILFVTKCHGEERLHQFYSSVENLGVFADIGNIWERRFYAFKLDGPLGPIGELQRCRPF